MKNLFCLLLSLVVLFSCDNEIENKSELDVNGINGEIELRKRDEKSPVILSKKLETNRYEKIKTKASSPLGLFHYLGRGYKTDEISIGDPVYVKFPVLDVDKLYADNKDYFLHINLGKTEAKSLSYSSFERYVEKSTTKNTVQRGSKLNIGLFSIGSQNKISSVFSEEVSQDYKKVFGELNINVIDASYTIQTSTNILNKIRVNYLHANFVDEIFNNIPEEVIDIYGGLMLMDYTTGGRAEAIFEGNYSKIATDIVKETAMDVTLDGTYNSSIVATKSGETPIGVSGNLSFSGNKYKGSTTSRELTDVKMTIKTIGGSKEYGSYTIPTSLETINLNMSSWVSSLNNTSTHNLIGINSEGLHPISNYILEENVKKNIESAFEKYVPGSGIPAGRLPIAPLREPYIYIAHTLNPTAKTITMSMALITRFNDEIDLSPSVVTISYSGGRSLTADEQRQVDQYYQQYLNDKSRYYKLSYRNTSAVDPVGYRRSNVPLSGIVESGMKKYRHPVTNVLYLLYNGGSSKKYAYAIHDDYILDTYCIRSWVNGMTATTISDNELVTYKIVGL